jgi:hypothetical protein
MSLDTVVVSEPATAGPSAWGHGSRWSDAGLFAVLVAASLAASLGIAAALLAVADAAPTAVFTALVDGGLGSKPALVTTLNHSALILTPPPPSLSPCPSREERHW